MKTKLSVTIEDSTMERLDELVKSLNFRNRSHLVESAIHMLIQEGRK